MFSNRIGSSLDYPNLYRRVLGQAPETYNGLWLDRFREASANQIEIGVITIPNEASFDVGAGAFYSYFCDEIGLMSFQLNTPFPGVAPIGTSADIHWTMRSFPDSASTWWTYGLNVDMRKESVSHPLM